MFRRITKVMTCFVISILIFGFSTNVLAYQRVSVHDPSIVYDNGTYYIFGSHLAQAKSNDLKNWTPLFTSEYENPSLLLGDLNTNLSKVFEWAGYDDADTSGGRFSIWAPDVIWNPSYKWADGSTGAYMYYFSSSSTWRRSVISYAVSKSIEGPYEFVDTIIYSGFTEKDATDGSSRNVHYANTNIKQLIEDGTLKDGFNPKWVRDNGVTYNNDYAPNAIDANVFFDRDGKLYMAYGSWSGGIYLIQLDPVTGQAIYPGVDGVTPDGRHIDRYFGTHLLGSWHQSGEAPYIIYDPVSDYYYLFMTYGGLAREGGYNMRLFRSKTVDGRYVDAKGNHPLYSGWTPDPINSQFGVKVMGNYDFNALSSAFMSPGHNSAFIDDQGNWYLIYHTRFNQGTEYHEVRVHQMVRNAEGWPVALPYEYSNETINLQSLDLSQLPGTYEFVNHGIDTSGKPISKASVELTADGKVQGDFDGTWQVKEVNGEYQVTFTDQQGATYTGIFASQSDESLDRKSSLVFTALGNNNTVIWGSKPYTPMNKGKVIINFRDQNDKELKAPVILEGLVGEKVDLPEAPAIEGYQFLEQIGAAQSYTQEDIAIVFKYGQKTTAPVYPNQSTIQPSEQSGTKPTDKSGQSVDSQTTEESKQKGGLSEQPSAITQNQRSGSGDSNRHSSKDSRHLPRTADEASHIYTFIGGLLIVITLKIVKKRWQFANCRKN